MTSTTTVRSAVCPTCGLEVDLTRGKLKDHPAADRPAKGRGSQALCPGSGVKPSPVANGDTAPAPADVTVVAPTLEQALLAANRPDGAWAGAEAATLDPALCDPDPNNPRRELGPIEDLALSLVAQGMLEPIIVAPGPTDGRFTIVAGHRRVAAALAANLTEVPALIRADLKPGSNLSLAAQVVENLHRLELSPLEEARAYDLLRQLGMKQTAIAVAVGVNQGQVSKRLALLKLPDELAARVGNEQGGLDVATAVEITRLPAAARKEAVAAIAAGAGDPEAVVRRARATADKAAEHDAIVDMLEAAHVALVDFPPSWHWDRSREDRPLLTGSNGERQPYGGSRTIDVDYADHHDQPCHGAAVSTRDEIIYVCLDPTRHGYATLEQEAAEFEAEQRAADEAREAEHAAAEASLAARRGAARAAALADVKRPYLTDTVAGWTVHQLYLAATDWYVGEDADLIGTLASWSGLAEPADDQLEATLEQLTAAHGVLRLAYMIAVAGGEALLDLPAYYRDHVAGTPLVIDHFNRLVELGGYEITDADRRLMQPPVPQGPVTVPEGEEPPAGALAWYDPVPEAVLEGDEPRWLTDPGELDAVIAAGYAHRLATLEAPAPSSEGEATDVENASQADPGDAPPDATPGSVGPRDPGVPDPEADDEPATLPVWAGETDSMPYACPVCGTFGTGAGMPDHLAAEHPDADPLVDGERDAGDVPVPGERCPASRRSYNVAGGAEGIECPLKCGALVSTTATGRVRDHDVPEG